MAIAIVINPVQSINDSVISFILNKKTNNVTYLVKKNSKNLKKNGDFSFLLQTSICCDEISSEEFSNALKKESKQWIFPLKTSKIIGRKCLLFFDRCIAIKILLQETIQNEYFGKQRKFTDKLIEIKPLYYYKQNNNLSIHRAVLVQNVIQKLLNFTEWIITGKNENITSLMVKSTVENGNREINKECLNIWVFCGIVCNSQNKAICDMTYNNYLCLRSKDMELQTLHKYGMKIHNTNDFAKLINKLGRAAVTIDLLEVKHTSPIFITYTGHGCSKGSSFILYNYARAERILKTFNERQISGYYPELTSFEQLDPTLLKEEEEWELLFNFVFYFPELIRRSTDGIEQGKCAPHLVVRFLHSLASLFSVYYRRVRILTENRTHLMPIMFSRIYLLKCIQKIFNLCFNIVGIDSVDSL